MIPLPGETLRVSRLTRGEPICCTTDVHDGRWYEDADMSASRPYFDVSLTHGSTWLARGA